MKKIYCKLENKTEFIYTEIEGKTPQDIIDRYLRPGKWKKVTLINPIVDRNNGIIHVTTSVYALSDEYMRENQLDNKYRTECITIYPEDDKDLGGLGVLNGRSYK